MEPLYPLWIAHVFDHPAQDTRWYLKDHADFSVSDAEFVWLFTQTMLRAGRDLEPFDDIQVSSGLNYIFNNSCSNYIFQLIDGDVSKEVKSEALLSVQSLYADCLSPRCRPVLSHLSEPGASPLNSFCYMLWEVTPLMYWEGRARKEYFYESVLQVLAFALRCPNIACQESALHGLNHVRHYAKKQVEAIVDDFLQNNPGQRREMLNYAASARGGHLI